MVEPLLWNVFWSDNKFFWKKKKDDNLSFLKSRFVILIYVRLWNQRSLVLIVYDTKGKWWTLMRTNMRILDVCEWGLKIFFFTFICVRSDACVFSFIIFNFFGHDHYFLWFSVGRLPSASKLKYSSRFSASVAKCPSVMSFKMFTLKEISGRKRALPQEG